MMENDPSPRMTNDQMEQSELFYRVQDFFLFVLIPQYILTSCAPRVTKMNTDWSKETENPIQAFNGEIPWNRAPSIARPEILPE